MMRKLLPYALVAILTLALAEIFHPLALLGSFAQGGCRTFKETGKTVCGKFLTYWDTHGGLAQQGFPISNAFVEVSELDGKSYTVQYFERAVFEEHPENKPPYDVLLSQLGTFQLKRRYPNGDPSPPVQASEFEVLKPYSTIKGANVVIYGAVRYNGTQTLINPEITVILVDNAGKTINSLPCCALVTLVTPGQLIPYRHEISDPDARFDRVQTTVKASPASREEIEFYTTDWVVGQSRLVIPTDNRRNPSIVGTLRHNGPETTESVNVAAILYDKSGQIIDVVNEVFTMKSTVQGATQAFELTFMFSPFASIGVRPDHYDLVIENDITPGN